jgi:hypothetical protein
MSSDRSLEREPDENGFEPQNSNAERPRGTTRRGLLKIPDVEESVRHLLSLEAPSLSSPEADAGVSGALKPHHFLQLLHLYLHPHLASRFPPLRTISTFETSLPVRFRPFRPTRRTLTYALAALRYQRARHVRGLELVQLFRERWGERFVGLVSWKILARYGLARRCPDTIAFARNGLWRWHDRERSRSRKSRKSGFTGAASSALIPSASRVHWRLSYKTSNLFDLRRLRGRLAAMQRRPTRLTKRRRPRQTRASAVQTLVARHPLV